MIFNYFFQCICPKFPCIFFPTGLSASKIPAVVNSRYNWKKQTFKFSHNTSTSAFPRWWMRIALSPGVFLCTMPWKGGGETKQGKSQLGLLVLTYISFLYSHYTYKSFTIKFHSYMQPVNYTEVSWNWNISINTHKAKICLLNIYRQNQFCWESLTHPLSSIRCWERLERLQGRNVDFTISSPFRRF